MGGGPAGERGPGRPGRRDVAAFFQQGEDPAGALGHGLPGGVAGQVGGRGLLVGGVDPGEIADFTGQGLAVEALGVPLHQDLQRRLQEHLQVVADGAASLLAAVAIGGDDGHQDDHAVAGQGGRHPGGPLHLAFPVGGGEAQVTAEGLAQDVAVQHLHREAPGPQAGRHLPGQRRLSGPWKAGKPYGDPAVGQGRTPPFGDRCRFLRGPVPGCGRRPRRAPGRGPAAGRRPRRPGGSGRGRPPSAAGPLGAGPPGPGRPR